MGCDNPERLVGLGARTAMLTLAYSTYLGGSRSIDQANGVATDAWGNAYVTGTTNSTDFPHAHPLPPTPCSKGSMTPSSVS
jgi:hypothetical protein